MGYTTDFGGSLKLTPKPTMEQINYINDFSGSRRMERNVNLLFEKYKGEYGRPLIIDLKDEHKAAIKVLEDAGLKVTLTPDKSKVPPETYYGIYGEFFACSKFDEYNDPTIINCNKTAPTQPGLWCQWVLVDGGSRLEWDGNEKFYNYIEWLEYLITWFFEPWGIKLNGEIEWVGEDSSDQGKIVVENNIVQVYEMEKTYKKVK